MVSTMAFNHEAKYAFPRYTVKTEILILRSRVEHDPALRRVESTTNNEQMTLSSYVKCELGVDKW